MQSFPVRSATLSASFSKNPQIPLLLTFLCVYPFRHTGAQKLVPVENGQVKGCADHGRPRAGPESGPSDGSRGLRVGGSPSMAAGLGPVPTWTLLISQPGRGKGALGGLNSGILRTVFNLHDSPTEGW